jgi:hypothetical protein
VGHARLFVAADSGCAPLPVDTQCEECFLCGSNDVTVRGADDAAQLEFATTVRPKVDGNVRAVAARIVECHDCGAVYAVDTSE